MSDKYKSLIKMSWRRKKNIGLIIYVSGITGFLLCTMPYLIGGDIDNLGLKIFTVAMEMICGATVIAGLLLYIKGWSEEKKQRYLNIHDMRPK